MNFEKMWRFHNISIACIVSIFFMKYVNFSEWLIFHMHVSEDDSKQFSKFDEIK